MTASQNLQAKLANFETRLREDGICYSALDLVDIRLESVKRDLRDGYEDVCIKVPSGTEVMMDADLARHLIAQL